MTLTRPSRIKQLPDDLIARIAAGEVVERPASVIKELVENSIDAGSTEITVAIEGAGRNKITIKDNGYGMTKEEALLSLRRHATSKILKLDDLEAIATFGFRGEALPSIASVSKMRMVTRFEDEPMGWDFQFEGGHLKVEKPVAREHGTTLEINELFFNTPARFKFMKADSTERSQCIRVFEELAFAHPDVTFHLQIEKGKTLTLQSMQKLKEEDRGVFLKNRMAEVWGGKLSKGLVTLSVESSHFSVFGVISDPHNHQATSRHQILYINQRPILNRRLNRAIYNAYVGMLPTMRHPSYILFLDVDPKTVDVNVHPAKREVKLTHESELFGFILDAVKKALMPLTATVQEIPYALGKPDQFRTQNTVSASIRIPDSFSASINQSLIGDVYPPLSKDQKSTPSPDFFHQPAAVPTRQKLKALAQTQRLFVIAEGEKGLFVLDQHAAAERITYERLLLNSKSKEPAIQMLLTPFTWEVALSLMSQVEGNLSVLKSLGFLIEPFGDRTFVIKGYPSVLGDKFDMSSLLDGLSDAFNEKSDRKSGHATDIQHKLAAMAACKASVKAGDLLSIEECQGILDQIFDCEHYLTCPHGRPTFLEFSYEDLKRRFRR